MTNGIAVVMKNQELKVKKVMSNFLIKVQA